MHRSRPRAKFPAVATCVLFASLGAAVAAQSEPAAGCAACHNGNADEPGHPPPHQALAESIHRSLSCTDCHQAVSLDNLDAESPRPHGETVAPVNCGECHEEEEEVYQKHGRLSLGMHADTPQCWNCHGAHDILPSSDRQSHVHPIHLPSTCQTCHLDVDLVKRHKFLREAPIKLYESSVHGRASRKGLYIHATCNDCHSAKDPDGKRTAHRILSPADPQSTINHFNIPDTCGECHKSVTKDYLEGIHGQLVKQRGAVDAPVCTTCHGEHGIIKPSDPRSPVSAAHVAESTCAPCHESAVLNEKYGVPAGRLRSYIDSYHGLKAKAGDVHVANCASCHGAHRILPSADPTSSIHPDNLRHTCGECHPGISAELAGTSIHETAAGIKTGWPHFFTVLYYWIIGVTIGLMSLHCVADWVRHLKIVGKRPLVVRMTPNETMQHWLLAITFIVLVISGFSLRFSEAWWVQALFGWGGGEGFLIRGLVHRVAAVLFVVCCMWHVFYLFTGRGRRWIKDMLARPSDVVHIKDSALFFLGAREERPRFGRFSYMEKCEYWALIWGGVIMTATGILLWFDDYFVETWKLPKGILDVVLVVHYYEAWLATLAILVWHGYSTMFSPHVYPMNPAWLTGKMPRDMYAHEHPEGPRLTAFVQRKLYEEEEAEPPPSGESVAAPGGRLRPGQGDGATRKSPSAAGDESLSRSGRHSGDQDD